MSASVEEITQENLDKIIREGGKPYTLVNFYATWCKPCKVEIPDLLGMKNDPDGKVNVVFISIDKTADRDEKLPAFLTENGIDGPSYFRGTNCTEFIKTLHPGWNERIPLNLLYSADGNLVEAIGITDPMEIEMILNRLEKKQVSK